MKHYPIGTRVILDGHWEFSDGTIGRIATPPEFVIGLANAGEWVGHVRTHSGKNGKIDSYFVTFDSPTDDGSGDGPYTGGEIDHDSLRLFDD